MFHGDIRLGDTHDFKFTTVQTTGAPFTLAGSPVISAYPSNSTTELTAGITLTVDFDSRTGLHNVRVVATSGNGYATATDYALVITTGTVNSVSVVGYVVATFSIENRSALMPVTAARTLVVDAAGLADATVVKLGPSGSATAQTARDAGAQLDGTVTSRMATYTQPTGFLAATFPSGTVANTTNITAGTITTTTNLTNAPTSGDLTATMKTSVTTAATAATPIAASVTGAVGSVTGNVGGNVTGTVGSVVGAVGSVTGNVGGNVTGTVASVVGNVAGNVTGSIGTITNTGIDGILDRSAGVETNFTLRQAMRLLLSSVVAKLSGAATATVTIRDINDTKARITATVDSDGNRTAVTTDVT